MTSIEIFLEIFFWRTCVLLKLIITWNNKKSLKISNGKAESVNQRTDNIIAKRKRTKGQTTIFKTLYIKLKIE
jgi:hypothetical protein